MCIGDGRVFYDTCDSLSVFQLLSAIKLWVGLQESISDLKIYYYWFSELRVTVLRILLTSDFGEEIWYSQKAAGSGGCFHSSF